MIGTLTIVILALAFGIQTEPPPKPSVTGCEKVSFTTTLTAGANFSRSIGPLVFEIRAAEDKASCDGWFFSLEGPAGHDFIYPVNPPLRFNPSWTLGCSYGLSAKQGLELKRNLRFILSEPDYDRIMPLARNGLWPGDSPDPDHAAEKYLKALDSLHTGTINLKTLHYEISDQGMIQSAEFTVDLVAPENFHFDASLKPHSVVCPAPFR